MANKFLIKLLILTVSTGFFRDCSFNQDYKNEDIINEFSSIESNYDIYFDIGDIFIYAYGNYYNLIEIFNLNDDRPLETAVIDNKIYCVVHEGNNFNIHVYDVLTNEKKILYSIPFIWKRKNFDILYSYENCFYFYFENDKEIFKFDFETNVYSKFMDYDDLYSSFMNSRFEKLKDFYRKKSIDDYGIKIYDIKNDVTKYVRFDNNYGPIWEKINKFHFYMIDYYIYHEEIYFMFRIDNRSWDNANFVFVKYDFDLDYFYFEGFYFLKSLGFGTPMLHKLIHNK